MKKLTCICLLAISLSFFVNEGACQKTAKENFLGIAKSYLEYSTKYYNLDSNTAFIVTAGYNKESTFFYKKGTVFFDITFTYDYQMVDRKYYNVYKLGNYKLIINDWSDLDSGILNKIFEQTIYEDLNRGKNNGGRIEDFHWWRIIFDKKDQVIYFDTGHIDEVIKLLKKNKVRFAKKFSTMDSNGRPKSFVNQ
jgi:hypothetical protein